MPASVTVCSVCARKRTTRMEDDRNEAISASPTKHNAIVTNGAAIWLCTKLTEPNTTSGPILTYQMQTNLSIQTMETSIWVIGSTSKRRGTINIRYWDPEKYLQYKWVPHGQISLASQVLVSHVFFHLLLLGTSVLPLCLLVWIPESIKKYFYVCNNHINMIMVLEIPSINIFTKSLVTSHPFHDGVCFIIWFVVIQEFPVTP